MSDIYLTHSYAGPAYPVSLQGESRWVGKLSITFVHPMVTIGGAFRVTPDESLFPGGYLLENGEGQGWFITAESAKNLRLEHRGSRA